MLCGQVSKSYSDVAAYYFRRKLQAQRYVRRVSICVKAVYVHVYVETYTPLRYRFAHIRLMLACAFISGIRILTGSYFQTRHIGFFCVKHGDAYLRNHMSISFISSRPCSCCCHPVAAGIHLIFGRALVMAALPQLKGQQVLVCGG